MDIFDLNLFVSRLRVTKSEVVWASLGFVPEDNIEEKIELLAGLSSPWPYLSEVDERLSVISAGPHWPWKSNMSERLQAGTAASRVATGYTTPLQERKVDLQAPENYTVNHFVDNTGEALKLWSSWCFLVYCNFLFYKHLEFVDNI